MTGVVKVKARRKRAASVVNKRAYIAERWARCKGAIPNAERVFDLLLQGHNAGAAK